jgi:hydroxyethylthiazole kinase-like sugar kinase family protein
LLDDLDVCVLNFDHDIFELRHDEAWIGIVGGAGPRRAAAVSHAPLARKDPAFEAVTAAIVAAAVAQEYRAQAIDGAWNFGQFQGACSADVAQGDGSAVHFDQA